MEHILFIGGAGYIGANLVAAIKSETYDLHVYDPNSSSLSVDNGNVIVHEGLLADIDRIEAIIESFHITTVVHLVSTLIPGSSYEGYKKEYMSVILPTIELMGICAKRHVKFVFFSSGGTIYGDRSEARSFDEDDDVAPISYYGWSKQMMENSILFMHRTQHLDYLILRPSNTYGHGQNLYGKQGLVAVAIGKILQDEPVEIWGDGSAVRDYIYIDDLTRVFWQLMMSKAENTIINVGSGEGYSVNEVLGLLKKVSGKELCVIYKNPRPVDVSYMVLNTQRLKQYVTFSFTSFEEGVRQFYQDSLSQKI